MKNWRSIKRVGVLLSGAGAALYPMLSCALGLGDIEVESRLNQPLRARIEIVGIGDQDNAPILARVAAGGLPSDAAENTGLLQSLKLSVEADAGHRYFVVVTSAEALTEPLFDLPVEVSDRSLQVVRNFSVFLDPAPLEEGMRSSPMLAAANPGPAGAGMDASAPRVSHGDTKSRSRPGRRRIARHLRVGAKLTLPRSVGQKTRAVVEASAVKDVAVVARSSTQEQLEGQLATLQQMLAKMQETISAQDAQIANLTRKIAVTSQAQRALSQTVDSMEDESKPETPSLWSRPTTYYGISVVVGIGALLAWVVARIRKAREVVVPRYPVTEHTPAPVRQPGAAQEPAVSPQRALSESGLATYTVAPTARTEELPAIDLDATLETAAMGENAPPERTAPRHIGSELELIAATDVMPFVMKRENQVEPVERRPAAEAGGQKLEMQPDGSMTNKEIIKLLEHSLDIEPHRVDLQLKLLEMYHQEALGNLENFHSLLNKVGADRRGLSPAQLIHVEMLQRTLDDGKTELASDVTAGATV